MQVVFRGRQGQFVTATSEYERIIAHAMTAAVKQAATAGRDAGRAAMASAGFKTSRWRNSIVFAMRPKRGDALTPWAWVHSTINFADVLEEGRTISGHPWLWIPTALVPQYIGDPSRQMTPKMYVANVGPLRKAKRPGKTPILLGLVRAGPSGRPTRKLSGGIRGSRGKLQWAPMFIGEKSVTIEKKMNVVPAIEAAANKVQDFYIQNLEKYEGR